MQALLAPSGPLHVTMYHHCPIFQQSVPTYPDNLAVTSLTISEVPVVDMSPGDRVLDLLSCLPWTGARARLVPRWDTLALFGLGGNLVGLYVASIRCAL